MFAHLHARSWFSLLAGGSPPEALVHRAVELGMPAVAVTDRNGVYGAVRFQNACREAGVKGIVGAEVTVEGAPLVLLARSAAGYAGLCRLITAAHLADRDEPSAPFDALAEHGADLICLTGGRQGRLRTLVAASEVRPARAWLGRLRELFGDRLHLELTHDLRPGDTAMIDRLVEMGRGVGVPIVAAGDARYSRPEDHRRYDLLSCIRLGCTLFDAHPERPVNAESYMKSEAQMRRLIRYPEAFENAAAIADACNVDLLPGYIVPPAPSLPDGRTAAVVMEDLCRAALPVRYREEGRARAGEQLAREIEVITGLGLEEFFLTVRQVVMNARSMGIRCAGRGSAANSIVAYLLGITGVDPIAHNLLFERFLHGGRKGIPDIDIDFDSERRQEVIEWMEEEFGIDQTAMTATVMTYQLRMALRDVAKALGWERSVLDELSRAVPPRRARSVWEFRDELLAIVGESALFDVLITMTAEIDDCPRHLGLHSGGMMLTRRPLYHFTPVQISANGVRMGQFDKDDLERLGIVKLDVLGLRMLAAVSEATELIARHEGIDPDIDELPLDDPEVFEMIRSGHTMGVFQIESQGQMHLLAQNQPECFDDLIAEIALFRPGPLQGGMVNPFVRRRRGLEKAAPVHPLLDPILEDTYGVMLFQEQVLEVAHRFAGMSLEDADGFRARMTKLRDREEMESMRGMFLEGTTRQGIDLAMANDVFDKLSKFVGFGFCRSHAAAFAKTVYHSAWLKRYHPAAFMAALMQHRPGMYNLTTLEQEARRLGVMILPPDINRSPLRYDLEPTEMGEHAIRKPLGSVRSLSSDAVLAIAGERMRSPFASVEDLYRRVAIPRPALEALAKSGALDDLAGDSRRALWEVGLLARRLGASGGDRPATLIDVPAFGEEDVPVLPGVLGMERLAWDYAGHGSPRRHPMTLLRRELSMREVRPIAQLRRIAAPPRHTRETPGPMVSVAGIVILRQAPPTANGVMFVTLEDESGFIQCIAYPAVRQRLGDVLKQAALIVRGRLSAVEGWRGIAIEEAYELKGMIGGYYGHASSYGGTDLLVREPALDGVVITMPEPEISHVQRRERRPKVERRLRKGWRGGEIEDGG